MGDPVLASFEAELRAVEEGHVARWIGGVSYRVSSDSFPGKFYIVTASAFVPEDPLSFDCTPEGHRAYADDHLHRRSYDGLVTCKHMALVGRSLTRRGYAQMVDNVWIATESFPFPEPRGPKDPFEGLPQ